jgi:hypothetical protein
MNKPTSQPDISQWKRIKQKIRHGLLLQSIRNQLAHIGIEISPYYLAQVGKYPIAEPRIRGDSNDFIVSFFNEAECIKAGESARGYSPENFLQRLKQGKKCYGIKHHDNIVAFVWFDLKQCSFKPQQFWLKKNEAYIHSMYTMEEYRGRNIARFLEFQSYQELKKMNKTVIYSISEYFNKAAIKYKKDLKAENLHLFVYIELFHKIKWKCKIRSYI